MIKNFTKNIAYTVVFAATLSSCATVFQEGPISECQKTKPAAGQEKRKVKILPLILDIGTIPLGAGIIGTIVDFSNGAIYKPCESAAAVAPTPPPAPVAAKPSAKDRDGDGVNDDKDECPDVAGLKKFNGCADTDGDGIQDSKDECPLVQGPAKFNGCPDTDGDGIEDSKDACPNIAGLAQFDGCIDSDADGVADNKDNCPAEKGTMANKGCPEISAEAIKSLAIAAKNIQFETGKDIIKTTSYADLDKIVSILKQYSNYNVKISGHTDNVGDAGKNVALSQKRATAAQNYLISKGVPSNRILEAKGFGSEKPVASNATPAGRTQNRRVELELIPR